MRVLLRREGRLRRKCSRWGMVRRCFLQQKASSATRLTIDRVMHACPLAGLLQCVSRLSGLCR